jgi:DNA-directed RNA polymerase specialized sigma24 family protein
VPLTRQIEDPSVTGARRGDPVAWADLYERFHPILERYLEIIDPGAGRDLDETWARAGRNLAGQPEGIDPLIWLLRTARDGKVSCPSPGDTDDPAIRAIRALTPLEMDVIALRVVAGLGEEDVAFVIGRPVERVRRAGHSGLAQLLREQAAA